LERTIHFRCQPKQQISNMILSLHRISADEKAGQDKNA
jgi:hypothetical protein